MAGEAKNGAWAGVMDGIAGRRRHCALAAAAGSKAAAKSREHSSWERQRFTELKLY
jgi:hypothetical protein